MSNKLFNIILISILLIFTAVNSNRLRKQTDTGLDSALNASFNDGVTNYRNAYARRTAEIEQAENDAVEAQNNADVAAHHAAHAQNSAHVNSNTNFIQKRGK